ncbi:hypothetical protein BKA82DRAFT_22454 [Pisolithus tinctorius]|uniref:Uncharacterized protein n=1 Tax=Pisolithus tinctorius Marx 270 TaxID=870435 RepID=A0A0C3PLU2_PISTI|nr:hypothetical protein BKA82DRAFT_22454 [Pisolithus tinctorius]KIO09264.1 hypothetical protein M404DRAFT_22454 [Pisolithus tinctorius Marx 270]
MSTANTANTSAFVLAQLTNNIWPVISTENAKWMVKEAATVTMQALRGLHGWDTRHRGKVAQLVWAQLGMVCMVVDHLPPAFKMHPHLIAINMHMIDLATIFAMQKWLPFNQMMTAQEGNVKDHAWYCLHHQPKSHLYYKVMEELTWPSLRAEHQAQPMDKGKGTELATDEAQGIWLPDAPMDTMARTTEVAMQKPGNEEDQNREKAWGHSQSRHGQPVAKPVNASDQTSRGQSQSRRPMKKVKSAVDEDVQDW